MSQDQADRNILFGILAVQLGFISRDQLVGAINTWVVDKARSLGEILQSQKIITTSDRTSLNKDVEKQLSIHGDPAKALAAIGPPAPLVEALSQIIDVHVAASVGQVTGRFVDQFATRAGIMAGSQVEPISEPPRFDQSSATYVDPFATRGSLPPRAASAKSELAADTFVGLRDSESVSASSIGTRPSASRFKVIRSHARGGLGEVFVAKDEELNREVALKEIQNLHADHPESRTRFILEAEITGALEHPGIVPVYGLGQYADGRPYYAMRFIRGDSLQDAITEFHSAESDKRDPGERAIALRALLRRFIDVCHAIAYAHSRGVIHRDIKPGNVMLGQYGETLVVDWGLAKPLGSTSTAADVGEAAIMPGSFLNSTATYVGLAVGTPQYMSPEQAAGQVDEMGPATDTYSLGATLYCLLTGKPPVEGGVDIGTLLTRVQKGDFRPPREVNPHTPQALNAICLKAMANRAEDRYSSPKELAGDIERWLADEPTTAWQEPWSMRARRWAKRHRSGVTSAIAALLVAGISLAIATVLLTAANARERAAKNEAREQRDEADSNYRLARRAVDRYHTEVSEDVLLHEPGTEPLRRKLLEAAREFYAKFVDQKSEDPRVKAELGRALFRLGQITADIDAPAKGVEFHKQALGIFSDLAASKPDDAEILTDRAITLHHLGRIQRELDQLGASRKSYSEALELWTKLQEAYPTEPRFAAEEARTRHGLGYVEHVLRNSEKARDQFGKALAMRESLVSAHSNRADHVRDLATTRHSLAMVQVGEGTYGPAEENYRKAMEAQEKLVRLSPKVTQYQVDLARTHFNLADLFRIRGQTEESIAEFAIAVNGWKELADSHPAVDRFHAGQARTLLGLCMARRLAKDETEAEAACTKAQEIYKRLAESGTMLPQDRAEVAVGQRLMGNLYHGISKAEPARAAFLKSIELLEPLTKEQDALPEYRASLARTWNNMGFLSRSEKKSTVAEAAFRKALTLWEPLVASYPENLDFAAGLAVTRRHLGELAREGGDAVAALERFGQAITALEAGAADRGKSGDAFLELRIAYEKRAETFADLNRHVDAVPDWERAVALAQGGDLVWARLNRALALGRANNHVRASTEADALSSGAKSTIEALYRLGCVYALAAAGVEKDSTLASDDRAKLVEAYAAKALDHLQRAADRGYFKLEPNREKLKSSGDLNAIRGREGFAALFVE